jgi:hypothetical protein
VAFLGEWLCSVEILEEENRERWGLLKEMTFFFLTKFKRDDLIQREREKVA